MLIAESFRNQQLDGLADQFGPRVTKQFFGLRIHHRDLPFLIHHNHRIGGRLHGQPEFLLCSFAVGEVAEIGRKH